MISLPIASPEAAQGCVTLRHMHESRLELLQVANMRQGRCCVNALEWVAGKMRFDSLPAPLPLFLLSSGYGCGAFRLLVLGRSFCLSLWGVCQNRCAPML